MTQNLHKAVEYLLEKRSICYISSVDGEGYPATKAMLAPRKREGAEVFYFTTNTSSVRVGQYAQNPKACIYFCDERRFCGVMLKGSMEVLTDADSKKMIWQPGDTQYYSQGVTDPDYCVLKFTAVCGRYYAGFQSTDFTL